MVEFLHFDIQSTGQKSHCVNIVLQPSQCYVLIRQSDSPSPYQFSACSTATRELPLHTVLLAESQSFSQSYGSNLPTSLTYIILLTRGYSPWRPDAVIGTTRCTTNPSPFHGPSVTGQTHKAPFELANLFANQLDSKVSTALGENRKLSSPSPPASASSLTLPSIIMHPVPEY